MLPRVYLKKKRIHESKRIFTQVNKLGEHGKTFNNLFFIRLQDLQFLSGCGLSFSLWKKKKENPQKSESRQKARQED